MNTNRMFDPTEVDLRQRLGNIKSRKRDRYGNVVVQDDIHRKERKEEIAAARRRREAFDKNNIRNFSDL